MLNKTVIVRRRIATGDGTAFVCGNDIYTITFDLDDEWSAYGYRTARFKMDNGEYIDVPFSGMVCEAPIFKDVKSVTIGLYEGDLHTTTGAAFPCIPSILCGTGTHAEPEQDVYNAIMEMLQNTAGPAQVLRAVETYLANNSIIIDANDPNVFAWAKEQPVPYVVQNVLLNGEAVTVDMINVPEAGTALTAEVDGTLYNLEWTDNSLTEEGFVYVSSNPHVSCTVNGDGTITFHTYSDSGAISIYYTNPVIETIPEERLPESVRGTWEEWEFILEDDTTVIKRVYVAGVE